MTITHVEDTCTGLSGTTTEDVLIEVNGEHLYWHAEGQDCATMAWHFTDWDIQKHWQRTFTEDGCTYEEQTLGTLWYHDNAVDDIVGVANGLIWPVSGTCPPNAGCAWRRKYLGARCDGCWEGCN